MPLPTGKHNPRGSSIYSEDHPLMQEEWPSLNRTLPGFLEK